MSQLIFLGSNDVNQADYNTGPAASVALVLSELAGLARWDLAVDAVHEGHGVARIGRVLTVPAAGYAASYGAPVRQSAVRVVAIATCPGAHQWRVTARALPWAPPGYDPARATPPYDPALARLAARAEVQLTPVAYSTSAAGLQPVDAGAPTDVPEVAIVDAAQVPVGVAPQLVLPEDADRVRAYLRCVGAVDVFLGPANVTPATGLRLAATDPALLWTPRRPLWGVSAGGAVLTVSVDRS